MKIGEHDLPGPQQLDLGGLRFLDFHQHIGAPVDLFGRPQHRRADGAIIRIVRAAAVAGAMLDEHGVTGVDQRFAVYWEKADAILVVLNLLRHTDDHKLTVAVGRSWPATSMRTRAGSFW